MIWNFAIRRPVFTIVLFLIVAIFGIFGFRQMPVRESPDVEFPIVSIDATYEGADPEVIETEIIQAIEEEVNTVEGLKELTSTAEPGSADITATFELWRDIDVAAQEVRDRVQQARWDLPEDLETPIVRKRDPGARAIMWIALVGNERWDQVQLTEYADNQLKERLETIQGVGEIRIGGERQYAVRVQLDPARLAAHHLTVQDVVQTIQQNNVDIPSGRIESVSREFLVRTQGQFASPEPINDLIVAYEDGAPVRVSDVGQAVAGVENDRSFARFAGKPTVALGVVKQSDANMVALAERVRQRVEEISHTFPPGIVYEIASDDSVYVQENINDLVLTIFIATALVALVLLVFLRSGWGTLITSLAIPASLLAGFAIMHVMGFSLNVMSMLGLILVIGIVVDDAIVVLENTYRHMEEGAEPRAAARTGTTEVAFPAIANSLSLAAVFVPVAFTGGLIGRFFFEFGITVAGTVFASTFVALTLTPMLCSRLLRVPERHGRLFHLTEKAFNKLEDGYAWLLHRAFRFRWVTVLIGIAALGMGIFFFTELPTEFSPTVDKSSFRVMFELPEGAIMGETEDYATQVEAALAEIPEIEHWFMVVGGWSGGVNSGMAFVNLTPHGQRDRHQSAIAQSVRERLTAIPAGKAFVTESSGGIGRGAPLQMVIQSPDLNALAEAQQDVMAWMRTRPEFTGVNSNLKLNKPQVDITIHREKAAQMGISVADISNTMRYLLGEPDIGEIERAAERYKIIPEISTAGEMTPDTLHDLYVRSESGELVSLGNLVQLKETVGPSEIHHYNRMRSVTISASPPPGVPLGLALDTLRNHLEDTLPVGFTHTVTGEAEQLQESFYYLSITIIFSVIFIYLVLAAQFESFLHPLTILLALPLASIGAFGGLWALGMSFNIFSFIGVIMLLGMVTKNAILLIDYANVLVARGRSVVDAARGAASVRFRPVLMTAISTVLGIMPIALGFGAGGEARAPLGVAVAAGMAASTALTLLVVPVVYTLFDQLQTWILHIFRRKQQPRPTQPQVGAQA